MLELVSSMEVYMDEDSNTTIEVIYYEATGTYHAQCYNEEGESATPSSEIVEELKRMYPGISI